MASDSAEGGRMPGRRAGVQGFRWVASAPSPAVVAELEVSYPEVVCLPVSELEEEAEAWQSRSVIAQSFQKWVPAEAMIREFRRAGVAGEIVPINLASRCHLFRFDSLEVRNQVLQRPWVVNGQVIGTEVWRPEFTPAEDSIKSALVWVRLPNLPLEFWKEGFLKAILEPAGSFVSIDAATRVKNRGGFARACIRIDLTRSLRPGVRVQGLYHPFWQPFVYECLEGICMRCGKLHLGGPCSAPEQSLGDSSASKLAFGPWLIAIRQRAPVSGSVMAESGSLQSKDSPVAFGSSSGAKKTQSASRPGGEAAVDGWCSPVKLARRRSSMARKTAPFSGAGSRQEEGAQGMDSQQMVDVPVTVGRAGTVPMRETVKADFEGISLNIHDKSKNPFAALVSVVELDGSKDSQDVFPGPVKRARPEVPLAQSSYSKLEIRKGKGKAYPSKNVRMVGLPSVQEDPSPGNQEGGQELVRTLSSIPNGSSSGVVGGINEGSVQGPSSEGQPSRPFEFGSGSEGQSVCSVPVSDSIMMEDQGGSQPPSICK